VRIVLLSKTDRFSREAQQIARGIWPDVEIAEGRVGDSRPDALSQPGDVLISFLSPWIIKADELDRFKTAINFHPASTDYPGSGCYNFALYDHAAEYGATCHHMLPKVDTGAIILERRFPVRADDAVETLKLKTMDTMLAMFREIAELIRTRRPLPQADVHWTRRPYTFREMEALKIIEHDMSESEVARRLRATVYPGFPGPVFRLADGSTRSFPMPDRAPLA
jgi:methionyl-tRNA formyltransferase